MFRKLLTTGESTLIDQVYALDDNPLEPVYVLRSIDRERREEWRMIEKDLSTILRRASAICLANNMITQSERNEFYISGENNSSYSILSIEILVTAKEINRALENNAIEPQRMVSFFREIDDIHQLDLPLKSKLVDTDTETELLLSQLKSSIREKLPLENQFSYRVCGDATYQTARSCLLSQGELARCLTSRVLSSQISN